MRRPLEGEWPLFLGHFGVGRNESQSFRSPKSLPCHWSEFPREPRPLGIAPTTPLPPVVVRIEAFLGISEVTGKVAHPLAGHLPRPSGDLQPSARQVDEEEPKRGSSRTEYPIGCKIRDSS